jgi:hypothetical protein
MLEPLLAVSRELYPLKFIIYRCLKQLAVGSVTVNRLSSI